MASFFLFMYGSLSLFGGLPLVQLKHHDLACLTALVEKPNVQLRIYAVVSSLHRPGLWRFEGPYFLREGHEMLLQHAKFVVGRSLHVEALGELEKDENTGFVLRANETAGLSARNPKWTNSVYILRDFFDLHATARLERWREVTKETMHLLQELNHHRTVGNLRHYFDGKFADTMARVETLLENPHSKLMQRNLEGKNYQVP